MSIHTVRRFRSISASLPLLVALFFFVPSASAHQQSAVVLFDEGHEMHFLIDKDGPLQLSQLAGLIRQQEAVVASCRDKLDKTLLADKQGLIISGPFAKYSRDEIAAVVDFVMEGGKLAVMLHIPMPAFSLLQRLNVLASKGVLQEHNNLIADDSKQFRTAILFPHPLTRNLQSFSLYGAWALLGTRPNVEILAETSPQAWIDLNGNNKQDSGDLTQPYAVVVAGRLGKGEYLVFGDDAIFQNQFLVGDNRKLAENLAAWLLQ